MATVEILVVLSTFADEEGAAQVGRQLVEDELVACAQIESAGLRSIYGWQGVVQDEREFLLRLKSAPERRAALMERLAELHPYDVPQIVVATAQASAAYGRWVRVQCGLEESTQG